MNKFPIGSIIKSKTVERLITDFKTTADGVGRFYFTQEYIETFYHLKEGEEDEN